MYYTKDSPLPFTGMESQSDSHPSYSIRGNYRDSSWQKSPVWTPHCPPPLGSAQFLLNSDFCRFYHFCQFCHFRHFRHFCQIRYFRQAEHCLASQEPLLQCSLFPYNLELEVMRPRRGNLISFSHVPRVGRSSCLGCSEAREKRT